MATSTTGTFVPPATNHQGAKLTPANNLEELAPVNCTKSPRSQWYRLETNRTIMTDISIYPAATLNTLFDSDPLTAQVPSAGTTIVITMSQPVLITDGTGFTVGGSPTITVTGASVSSDGLIVTLTLSTAVLNGQTRTVSYSNGNMKLKDTQVPANSFTAFAITNNVP